LHREYHHRGLGDERGVVGRHTDAVGARETLRLFPLDVRNPHVAGAIAFRREPSLHERTGHVAGADDTELPHAAPFRGPQIAVPTRTSVAPSSIATSKSALIPIESSLSVSAPSWRSRSWRSAAKKGRTASGPSGGGMVIKPRTRSERSRRATVRSRGSSP